MTGAGNHAASRATAGLYGRGGRTLGSMLVAVFMACMFAPPATAQADPADDAATTNDQTAEVIPFERLTPRMQRVFELQAPRYLRVGQDVWSIEVWLRRERLGAPSRASLEPYLEKEAPIFFNPVTGERTRTLGEIDKEAGEVAMLLGKPIEYDASGALFSSTDGIAYVRGLPREPVTDRTGRTLVICQRDGEFDYYVGRDKRTAPAVKIVDDGPVRKVSPAELAQWVQRHEIERFEQWRFRKVWDRDPKAKKVYVGADGRAASTDTGGEIGAGTAEPVEVITDRGAYHYEWTRVGRRVPYLRAADDE